MLKARNSKPVAHTQLPSVGLLRRRVTVLGKLFTPIVPLFAKQQNWLQIS